MAADRSRYRPAAAAAGAAVLAASVFLPWYGASFSASGGGGASAQAGAGQVAAGVQGSALQSTIPAHARTVALERAQLTTLSAHEALKYVSVVLLVLAGMAMLDALVALVRGAAAPADGAGAALAVLGAVALALVAYRIVAPPSEAQGVLALSPSGGAWLALGASAAVVLAGVWPRGEPAHRAAPEGPAERALTALSGLAPEGGRERRARSARLGPRRGPREP